MKRLRVRAALAGILAVLLGLVPAESKSAGPEFRILVTVLPVYTLTLNVVGHEPGVRVELLLPPTLGCPHDYDLSPGEMRQMNRAGVIVANGLGLEGFLEKALRQSGTSPRIITATAGITPLKGTGTAAEHLPGKASRHDHRTGPVSSWNAHAWVSPQQAAVMVRTIAEGLAGVDPARAGAYRAHGAQYAQRLEALHREMRSCVERAKNRTIVTVHDSLDYWARDLGLRVAGVIQSLPGLEPSPLEMARLVRVIREQKVAAIFSEPQYSDRVARALSAETGVRVFSLDTVATGKPGPDLYEQTMRKNRETLCRAFP